MPKDTFVMGSGKKVRKHWEKGCKAHDAFVEVYGSDEPAPKGIRQKSDDK